MRRVLKALRRVRKSGDPEAVHRLRVALRRCRSLAMLMEEVDPHQAWTRMRRLPGKLFRTLGELRDTQVLEEGVKNVTLADDPLRQRLLKVLERREVKRLARARRAVEQFDQRAWTHLARNLRSRTRLVPPNGLAAQCLALERYQELRSLHVRAVRTQQPQTWHALRVSVKRFRYTVESVLPARAAAWDAGLRQMQDRLGEIHDLDILIEVVASEAARGDVPSVDAVRQRIRARRQACIDQYRQRTRGRAGLLREWNAGLPRGAQIEKAASARLEATARAMDPDPRSTALISELALQLFDTLVAAGAAHFRDVNARRILLAASQLHAIGGRDRHTSQTEGGT